MVAPPKVIASTPSVIARGFRGGHDGRVRQASRARQATGEPAFVRTPQNMHEQRQSRDKVLGVFVEELKRAGEGDRRRC